MTDDTFTRRTTLARFGKTLLGGVLLAGPNTREADVVAVPVGPDGIPGGARSVEGAARVAEEEDLDYTRFFRCTLTLHCTTSIRPL